MKRISECAVLAVFAAHQLTDAVAVMDLHQADVILDPAKNHTASSSLWTKTEMALSPSKEEGVQSWCMVTRSRAAEQHAMVQAMEKRRHNHSDDEDEPHDGDFTPSWEPGWDPAEDLTAEAAKPKEDNQAVVLLQGARAEKGFSAFDGQTDAVTGLPQSVLDPLQNADMALTNMDFDEFDMGLQDVHDQVLKDSNVSEVHTDHPYNQANEHHEASAVPVKPTNDETPPAAAPKTGGHRALWSTGVDDEAEVFDGAGRLRCPKKPQTPVSWLSKQELKYAQCPPGFYLGQKTFADKQTRAKRIRRALCEAKNRGWTSGNERERSDFKQRGSRPSSRPSGQRRPTVGRRPSSTHRSRSTRSTNTSLRTVQTTHLRACSSW